MLHHFIEDAEPVSGWCLAVWPIRPEFCEDTCIIAERDQLLLIGQARVGVHIMARSGVSASEVVVKVPVIEVIGRQFGRVPDAGRAGVDHDAIEGVVVGLPDAHHRKMVLVHAVDGGRLIASDVHRSTRIEPGGPQFAIPLIQSHLILFKGKGSTQPHSGLWKGGALSSTWPD